MNGELAERPRHRPYGLPDKSFTRRLRQTARSVTPRIVVQPWARTETELAAMAEGLFQPQARISPKYFYDAVGCALFADICRLQEYYLTRTEAEIFATNRSQIAARLPSKAQWVDLGCGDGTKSQPWLAATQARRFVGVDIAQACLAHAVGTMATKFPLTECLGVVADLSLPIRLHDVLAERPGWPTTFFYPGSSLGNFMPSEALVLLQCIRAHLADDEALLIGIDLVKAPSLLEAAYNDSLGVTAAFNRNVLRVVNRLLDAEFDLNGFEHHARFVPQASRIEMRLRARKDQLVRIGMALRRFAAGETILTEYSYKYTADSFMALLRAAGFSRHRMWSDARGWFGVFQAQP